MNKILKILLVILILITVAEGGFYLYIVKTEQKSDLKISQSEQSQTVSPTGLPARDGVVNLLTTTSGSDYLQNQFLPELLQKKDGQQFYLIKEETGVVKVSTIDQEDRFVLTLNDIKGQEIVTYHTKQKFIADQKFYKEKLGRKDVIDRSQIKVGDRMSITSHINLNDLSKSYKEYIVLE